MMQEDLHWRNGSWGTGRACRNAARSSGWLLRRYIGFVTRAATWLTVCVVRHVRFSPRFALLAPAEVAKAEVQVERQACYPSTCSSLAKTSALTRSSGRFNHPFVTTRILGTRRELTLGVWGSNVVVPFASKACPLCAEVSISRFCCPDMSIAPWHGSIGNEGYGYQQKREDN